MPVVLSPDEARWRLVAHAALAGPFGRGPGGIRALLGRLRCIQLDPLDAIGTNADLVVMARVDGVGRGDVWKALFPCHAFEHFAKERCILPAEAFPMYRERGHAAETPWWQHGERERRIPPALVARVLAEVQARGPVTARQLTDHGAVEALDWSGWKGTSKATTMALEMLWTRCDVVVAGRTSSGAKLYDAPGRALGAPATELPAGAFEPWALRERVRAAGLLTRAGGSMWSMLSAVRTSDVPDRMLASGELVEVLVEGSSRRYLALPEFLSARRPRCDGRVRILGPLDPLLWDRDLVRHLFGFDYVWEVYKPEHQRRWGWYVCPLLYRGVLVGRVDAAIECGRLVTRKIWLTEDTPVDAVRAALERHAGLCRCRGVRMPRQILREEVSAPR